MIKNISTPDRILRLVVAAVILGLYLAGAVSGTLGMILLLVAAIFTITSVVNYCPMYQILGMNRWVKKS